MVENKSDANTALDEPREINRYLLDRLRFSSGGAAIALPDVYKKAYAEYFTPAELIGAVKSAAGLIHGARTKSAAKALSPRGLQKLADDSGLLALPACYRQKQAAVSADTLPADAFWALLGLRKTEGLALPEPKTLFFDLVRKNSMPLETLMADPLHNDWDVSFSKSLPLSNKDIREPVIRMISDSPASLEALQLLALPMRELCAARLKKINDNPISYVGGLESNTADMAALPDNAAVTTKRVVNYRLVGNALTHLREKHEGNFKGSNQYVMQIFNIVLKGGLGLSPSTLSFLYKGVPLKDKAKNDEVSLRVANILLNNIPPDKIDIALKNTLGGNAQFESIEQLEALGENIRKTHAQRLGGRQPVGPNAR